MRNKNIFAQNKKTTPTGVAQPELMNEQYAIHIQEESDIHATTTYLHRDPVFNAFRIELMERWRGKDELVKFLNELAKSIDYEFDN